MRAAWVRGSLVRCTILCRTLVRTILMRALLASFVWLRFGKLRE